MRDFVFPVGTRWRMGWHRGVAPIYSAASFQSRNDDAGFAGTYDFEREMTTLWPNQSAAANRRPAGQLDGSDNLSAIVAADRAFPAAVAELGR